MTYKLPIFPLPSVVLFPRAHLPLHIFEDRYRTMVEDVLKGDGRLAIAQLREGYHNDYFGSPPIFRVMTSARVLFADRQDDGRWNILVEGIERVELIEEPQQTPYRIGRVEPMLDEVDESRREETQEEMRAVASVAEELGRHFQETRRAMNNIVNTWRHPGIVSDLVTSVLIRDPYARQSILAEREILRRLRLVNIQLHLLVAELREKGIEVNLPAGD